MSDESTLIAELEAAIAACDEESLARTAEAIDRHAFDLGSFPHGLFAAVVAAVASEQLQTLPNSLPLIKMFEYELDLLSAEQRDALGQTLLSAMPRLADEIAAFLAAELVCDLLPATQVRDQLNGLVTGAAEPLLLMLVHGWDWLAKRNDDDDSVRAACNAALHALSKHPSRAVSAEAAAALRRRFPA